MKIQLISIFTCLLAISACKSLDDDTSFYPRTQSIFFLCKDTSANGLTVVKYENGAVAEGWNNSFGISSAQLGDFRLDEEEIWMSNLGTREVHKIDASTETIEETFSDLNLSAHFLCPGRKYLLISDSTASRIAFLNKRSGEATEIEVTGKPGRAVYNNGKFYLDIDGVVNLYNESALTPYAYIPTGNRITGLQLDNYKNVQVQFTDDSLNYSLQIDPNGDLLSAGPYNVSWSRARYTPWYSQQYGNEYLQNLFLTANNLNLPGFADSIEVFEMDFFEGRLFATWNDSMAVTNLHTLTREEQIPFPWVPRAAYFFIAPDGE